MIKWRPLESYGLLGILILLIDFVGNKPCFIKLASFNIHILIKKYVCLVILEFQAPKLINSRDNMPGKV